MLLSRMYQGQSAEPKTSRTRDRAVGMLRLSVVEELLRT